MKIIYNNKKDIFPSKIETNRLIFEKISYKYNVKKLYDKYKDIDKSDTQYVTFEPYDNRIESKKYIENSIKKFENGESASYFILLKKENNKWIGTTGFEPTWDKSIAESGIFIFRDHWGNGYSTERGNAMVKLAFEEYDFKYWISKCHPENKGSIKAIEKYVVDNGGERVGVLPNWFKLCGNSYDDILYFKLSREDYFNYKY